MVKCWLFASWQWFSSFIAYFHCVPYLSEYELEVFKCYKPILSLYSSIYWCCPIQTCVVFFYGLLIYKVMQCNNYFSLLLMWV